LVDISLFNTAPVSGGGTVAWVQFDVIASTGESSVLQWTESSLNEGAIAAVEVGGLISVVPAQTSLSLPDDAAGTPGGTVIVPIDATPADGIGLDLMVEFDPTVIQFVSATTTPISSAFSLTTNLVSPGELAISLFNTTPLSGSGSIVDLEFLVVGGAGDLTPLMLTRGEIDEGGVTTCLNDGVLRICGSVAADDFTCDGVDDDCNGLVDDGYVPQATSCGVGACSGNAGTLECIGGVQVDNCDPLAGAAPDDPTCDGVDDDCDGADDEDYAVTPTSCGEGECTGNTGQLECQGGAEVDTCDPLAGATADDQCDTLDNDCDGTPDDDYVVTPTTCGTGQCTGNAGQLECQAGTEVDTCDPLAGATPDDQCDGADNDCDGVPDDEYVATPTTCGLGECAGNAGLLTCVAGGFVDTCDPFFGATPEICDGLDNDCNGTTDSDGPPAGDVGDAVRFGVDKTVITWTDLPDANFYNVYRGNIIPGLGFAYDHTCHEPQSPDAQTEDTANPIVGRLFYYLVSASNSCQGEDTLGTDSAGTDRPNGNPCP
jgi:hypothetical protein